MSNKFTVEIITPDSLIFKLEAGSSLPASVYLGSMDMLILSGKAEYTQEDVTSILNPATCLISGESSASLSAGTFIY